MPNPENVDASQGIYPKYLVFDHPPFEPDSIYADAVAEEISETFRLTLVEDWVFVLKPKKDYHARVALAAYAESVRHWNSKLADDLDVVLAVEWDETEMEPT